MDTKEQTAALDRLAGACALVPLEWIIVFRVLFLGTGATPSSQTIKLLCSSCQEWVLEA